MTEFKAIPQEDDEWVTKAQTHPQYFDFLYEKYFSKIYIFVYKRTYNEVLSGELCSNVFYKALLHIKQFKNQGFPFSSWLFKIASNEISMHFRNKSNAERHLHIESTYLQAIADEYDFEKEKTIQILENIIPQLTEAEIQLIEFRFFEARSFKEIGYLLNISADNAKIKTYRIVDKLKTLIKQLSTNDEI